MHYTTYLKWVVFGSIFLIPFVPFVVADGGTALREAGEMGKGAWLYIPFVQMYFPFITGKNFVFRILVEVAAGATLLLALRDPAFRPKRSWLLWSVGAFVMWMGLATLISMDPIKSFWSNFERMEGFVGLLHVALLFVVIGAVLNTQKLWERFFNTTIAASMAMGVYALFQVMGVFYISTQSGTRADATFGNATYLAVYMLFHIFLTLYMLLRRKERVGWQIFYGLALVLQVVALFVTETRGAFLGLLGGLVVTALYLVLFARGSVGTSSRKWAFGVLVVVAVLVGAFFALRDTSVVQGNNTLKRLADISLQDRTTVSRFIYIWPMALKGAMERPITGWGQENFSYVFNKYYDPGMYDQEQWFDRAHNQFLDWLIAGGALAFALYLSLYAWAVWIISRSEKLSVVEQAVLIGLLAGFAFNNMLVFDNLGSSMMFFVLLGFLHFLSKRELPSSFAFSRPLHDHTVAVLAPVVVVVFFATGWVLNAPGMARANVLVTALATQGSEPIAALDTFEAAAGPLVWPGNPHGKQEVAEQLLQYTANVLAPAQGVTPALKERAYRLSRATAEGLLAERKDDARLMLFMSAFLGQFGQQAEALQYVDKALALSPQKQQIFFQKGFLYLQAGNIPQAQAVFKTAYDLDPRYQQADVFYASGFYYAGSVAEGDAVLVKHFGSVLFEDERLLRVYSDLRMYDRLIAIWNARVERDPQNTDIRLSLAEQYFTAGRMSETIAELQKIAQINPALASRMQQLITQIQNGTIKPPR